MNVLIPDDLVLGTSTIQAADQLLQEQYLSYEQDDGFPRAFARSVAAILQRRIWMPRWPDLQA